MLRTTSDSPEGAADKGVPSPSMVKDRTADSTTESHQVQQRDHNTNEVNLPPQTLEKNSPSVVSSEEPQRHETPKETKTDPQSTPSQNKELSSGSKSSSSVDVEARANESNNGDEDSKDKDPFSVGWKGKDDPEYPYNWPSRQRGLIIAVMSAFTLITPLASSMFAPAIPQVQHEFHSTNELLGSFVVSVFLIGYVAGPLVAAPLAEYYGKTWVYNVSNCLFVVFTIACAVSTNLNMLIGFRFLAGTVGSTPLILGGGTIGDTFPQERRGGVMALWAMGPLLGPVIGPIAGGFIAETIGWRWVFWVLAIASGVIAAAGIIILRETYAPVLLERKAKALRISTGDDRYHSSMADQSETPKELVKRSIIRPMKMLFLSPIVLALSLYMSVIYGYLYLLFTTLTTVFEGKYHFGAGVVGLSYLGIGVGMFIGLLAFGTVSDRMIKSKMAKGIPVKPEIRLPPMIPATICIPIGLFWYGWSAEAKVFWIMPIIGTAFVGVGLVGSFMPVQTYLVDTFTVYAASAIAANTILRSLVGAVLPLAGGPLYTKLGYGWGNSLLAFIALAMVPIPIFFFKYGERVRTNKRFQIKF